MCSQHILLSEPEIAFSHVIKDGILPIGEIALKLHWEGQVFPSLEYAIDEPYRGKGIMSSLLPTFLLACANQGFNKLIAFVEEDNYASKRLIEKNDFVFCTNKGNVLSYVRDARVPVEQLRDFMTQFNQTEALKNVS